MDNFDLPQIPEMLEDMNALFDKDELVDEDGFIECPFFPLRDLVLFPLMVMPLFIGRERSLEAIKAAEENGESLILAAQVDADLPNPSADEIFSIGAEAVIGRTLRLPDNSTSVLAQGKRRVEIVEFVQWDPYVRVRARIIQEDAAQLPASQATIRAVLEQFEKAVTLNRNLPAELYSFAANLDQPGWLADFVASALNLPLFTRQDLLETFDPVRRLEKVSVFLAQELDVLVLENEIHAKVQREVDRSQREHFLREQMRVIQGELGENDIFSQELSGLLEIIDQKKLPAAAKARVDKEVARLRAMPPMSPEVGIIRTYLDCILELPWLESSEDNLDLLHASEVLDADHYGLAKVKERVLEYIAVKQLAGDKMKTPILCFVGPPGTGKTSMGRSIAKALGREFIRISLGGVRDEAEIRGHRRTYIGALPGRIIQAMRKAGFNNPLFMLDEVDKIGQDFRGDPTAALLEVLDPEQNNSFADHYLELDFDLSKAMFITTANTLNPIPPPLRDRMEVIEFSGYLEEEKLEICRQFLIPRQLVQHGLRKAGLRFDTRSLSVLAREYTYEAGVRDMERQIATICRKTARLIAERSKYARRITPKQLVELLGPPKFSRQLMREEDEVGVATGVAWTAAGGDIMSIEVNLMPGKGKMTLTGKLGEVMQESAQAALSYTRSQALYWSIPTENFDKSDIHLHIPEGAVPKDGPSAGIPLAVALISAFTNRPIRRDFGMTGEITLRGRALPVGGIREKALACRRAGIDTFFLPRKNEYDLLDIPEKLRQDLNFVLIDNVQDVLDQALLLPLSNG